MKRSAVTGHGAALLTVLVWGTTFISTKILLTDFSPIEILFLRFSLGFLALLLTWPRRLQLTDRRQEGTFALAGLCGVTLYFLLENIALTYTLASNVGVIISAAPFFTAIFTRLFQRGEERLQPSFFAGLVCAMTGVCLISLNSGGLQLNPIGDLLALLAAIVWAVYSVLIRRINGYGYGTIPATRRVFFYGLLWMTPALFFMDFHPDSVRLMNPVALLNLLFLGLGASALCFVTWNAAIRLLGAVKTSVYIYLVPVITIVTSVIVLREPVTWWTGLGAFLTLLGLFLSEGRGFRRRQRAE